MKNDLSFLPDLNHQVALGERLDDTGGHEQAPVLLGIIVANPEIPVMVFVAV